MNKKITSVKEKNKKKFEMIQRQYKLVWTDNDIALNLVNPFSVRQLKIIDYVITEIDTQQIKTLNRDYVIIRVRDILNFYTNSTSGTLLKAFEDDIKKISDISAWWRYDENDPKKKTLFRYFQNVDEYEKGDKSVLKIGFNEHLLKRLYNSEPRIATDERTGENLLNNKGKPIKIGFNKYELEYTRKLKSKYSILFYKKCNVWKNSQKGYFIYEIKDLKKDFLFLDTPKKTYTYGYISSHVIIPAMKEINEKTNIHISSIELLPNGKNVERLKVNLNEKSKEKQERKMNEGEKEIIEKVDKQKEQYHDKLLNQKVKTDEKKAQETHIKIEKRQNSSYFENVLKENEEKLKNGEIDILNLIKEHEKKTNKVFSQDNIDYFVSENLNKELTEENYNNRIEKFKEDNIDYEKFLDAQDKELKNIPKLKLNKKEKIQNRQMHKLSNLIDKYGVFDNRKFEEYTPEQQEQLIDQSEKWYKNANFPLITENGIIEKAPNREEIRKELIKSSHRQDDDIDDEEIKRMSQEEIEYMRRIIEKYDKEQKKEP